MPANPPGYSFTFVCKGWHFLVHLKNYSLAHLSKPIYLSLNISLIAFPSLNLCQHWLGRHHRRCCGGLMLGEQLLCAPHPTKHSLSSIPTLLLCAALPSSTKLSLESVLGSNVSRDISHVTLSCTDLTDFSSHPRSPLCTYGSK
jgi:hypothetical protein